MERREIVQIIDDLHRTHRQIGELNYRIQRARRTVAAGVAAKKKADDALAATLDEKKNLLLIAAEKEREAAQIADDLARRRERLETAKSEREYATAKVQLELGERKNDEAAEAALAAISDAEEFEPNVEAAQKAANEAAEKLEKARAALAENEPKWNADIERAQGRLREYEAKLPREFAGIYVRLVKNFGGEETFAPLTNKVYCGFCNCQTPLEIIVKARAGQAVVCPSCGRMIYAPEGFDAD